MRKAWGIGAVMVALSGGAASADAVLARSLGTLSSRHEPVFKDGIHIGCNVTFAALIARSTGFSRVDGYFELSSPNKVHLLTTLNLVVKDIDDKTFAMNPNAPTGAVFVSGTSTSRPYLVGQAQSKSVQGALTAVFNAESVVMLVKSANDGVVTVGFTREDGAHDTLIPIDLSIESTNTDGTKVRSGKTVDSFMDCASAISKGVRQNLQSLQ